MTATTFSIPKGIADISRGLSAATPPVIIPHAPVVNDPEGIADKTTADASI